MPSLGAHLRCLREARGVSLKEMARSTRVRERYLEALETDDLTELPAPVFARGFVRAYCQALGEPPEEALRLYAGQAGLPEATDEKREPPRLAARESRGREPVLVSLVLLVVLGLALFAVTFALQGRSKPGGSATGRSAGRVEVPAARSRVPAPVETPSPPVAGAPAPETPAQHPSTAPKPPPPGGVSAPESAPPTLPAPAPRAAPSSSAADAPAAYRLVARVTERTWLRVRTDDGLVTEETVSAGDVREWVSNRRFLLTIGNAGGLALELNGQALPPLGPSGVVITNLVIPPDGR